MDVKYYKHYFYCYKHDDGFIVLSTKLVQPYIDNIIHCGCNDCEESYEGLKPRTQRYYDSLNGGWKVKYFNDNIYLE
jgi:hypothetical protein